MRLKLNASKTELIWLDRHANRSIQTLNINLDVDANCIINPVALARDLGVLLDTRQPAFNVQSHHLCGSVLFLSSPSDFQECLRMMVQAMIISRLDYCNSVLTGLADSTVQPLTKVFHTAA